MRASQIEFRFRLAVIAVIVSLGFWAPWIESWGVGSRISLLEWSALQLSRLGLLSFTSATPFVIVVAAVIAALGAFLRVWGTAWLGAFIVDSLEMRAGDVMAGGPFRYVRNPLYLGTGLMIAAMSFAMPVSGALLALVLTSFFQLRLIFGEEAFLSARLGQPYRQYQHTVPRLFPWLRSNLPAAPQRPQWGRALLAEANPVGVFLIVAILSWRYENALMIKAFLISFGVSLVLRAFVPTKSSPLASAP